MSSEPDRTVPRLKGDVKKHEQKNNGNFYAGSGTKIKTGVKPEKHNVGTIGKHK